MAPSHYENLCNFHPFHPLQLTVSKFLYFISMTLNYGDSQCFTGEPCTKADIDFVEIKCPTFNEQWFEDLFQIR